MRPLSSIPRLVLVLSLAAAAAACTGARPRFDPDVQTAVAQASMRRLETDELIVYYPEQAREQAAHAAARIEQCTKTLRAAAVIHSRWSDQKLRIVIPDIPMNNAFVAPGVGGEAISVVPSYNTSDIFGLFHLPPDPGVIGCHEAVHYVQSLQASGFHGFMSLVFGSVYTPQIGLDSWFQEGLAVYYETRLQGGMGRLSSRFYEGVLAAGVAETGIDTGMLHRAHRTPLYSGPYLIGSRFIDWLARNKGEKALWELVGLQSSYFLFPFGLERRFQTVYGESLTTLAKTFAKELQARYPRRAPPASQHRLALLGSDARHAWGPAGLQATISQDVDRPPTLTIYRKDGAVMLSRGLVDVLPERTLVQPYVSAISGMSFTRDGSALYFVVVDQGPLLQRSQLVRVDVTTGELRVAVGALGGSGGGIAPDGKRYVFSRAEGEGYGLAFVDVDTGKGTWLRGPEAGKYYLWPRVSPDGTRIAAACADRNGFWIEVLDARSGRTLAELSPRDGQAMTPEWADNERVVWSSPDGERMQIMMARAAGGGRQVLTDAPYLAFAPQSDGSTIRFLNRSGWKWTLDEVGIPEVRAGAGAGARAGAGAGASAGASAGAGDERAMWPTYASYAASKSVKAPATRLVVHSDEPYTAWDGFFYPQARGAWLQSASGGTTIVGVGALGGDRLGRHRWSLGAGIDLTSRELSGQAEYINAQLAPVQIGAALAHLRSTEQRGDAEQPLPDVYVAETIGALLASRSWYDATRVSTGLRLDTISRRMQDGPGPFDVRQFAGYVVSAGYGATESTPYTGLRRALAVQATGTYFPKVFEDQPYAMTDGAAVVVGTLPVLRRLMMDMELRGRYLGGPGVSGLLQVGGLGAGIPVSQMVQGNTGSLQDRGVVPPGMRFFEALSGFEDYAIFDRGAALGELALRYPLIFDWGSLSALYVLPSFLLRQVDLELFGSGAWLADRGDLAGAAGARGTVRTMLWVLPLAVRVQVARRVTDDEKFTFFGTLLLE